MNIQVFLIAKFCSWAVGSPYTAIYPQMGILFFLATVDLYFHQNKLTLSNLFSKYLSKECKILLYFFIYARERFRNQWWKKSENAKRNLLVKGIFNRKQPQNDQNKAENIF